MLHSGYLSFLLTGAAEPNSSESREKPLNIQNKLKFPFKEQLANPCFLYAGPTKFLNVQK